LIKKNSLELYLLGLLQNDKTKLDTQFYLNIQVFQVRNSKTTKTALPLYTKQEIIERTDGKNFRLQEKSWKTLSMKNVGNTLVFFKTRKLT